MRYSERLSYAIATLSLSQHILSLTFEKNIIDQFPKAWYNKLNPHPLANSPVKQGCMPIQREAVAEGLIATERLKLKIKSNDESII